MDSLRRIGLREGGQSESRVCYARWGEKVATKIRSPLAYNGARTEAEDAVSLTPLCLAGDFGADNPQTAVSNTTIHHPKTAWSCSACRSASAWRAWSESLALVKLVRQTPRLLRNSAFSSRGGRSRRGVSFVTGDAQDFRDHRITSAACALSDAKRGPGGWHETSLRRAFATI